MAQTFLSPVIKKLLCLLVEEVKELKRVWRSQEFESWGKYKPTFVKDAEAKSEKAWHECCSENLFETKRRRG